MLKLLEVLAQTLTEGHDCLLATVIESSGSTPRSAGAYMLVGSQGRIYGTIGGGNLEYQAILKGQKQIAQQENFLFEYVLTAEKVAGLGMICGGSCKVLFCYLNAADKAVRQSVEQALAAAKMQKPYWLLLPFDAGPLKVVDNAEVKGRAGKLLYEGKEYYAEQFAYDGKVYIFGGGHLAQEVVPLLAHLDFTCVVIDDREEFSRAELFPGAAEVLQLDFKQLSEHLHLQQSDYAAVMTRGHLHDADVERFLLNTDTGYIGVVGSSRKAQLTRETLLAEGYSKQQLDRIITPIGLDIGSETPAEISVSIVAQLIQERAARYNKA